MAYKLQLQDTYGSTIRNVMGYSPRTPEWTAYINEAQSKLARRGKWDDMTWTFCLVVSSWVVAWPRYIKTILGLRGGGWKPAWLHNNWYSFTATRRAACGLYTETLVEDANPSPIISEITGCEGGHIRYCVAKANDVGKTITLWGQQFGGQPLQQKDANNNWVEGVTLVSNGQFVQTVQNVTHVQSVIRDATQGMAYLYEWWGGDAPTFPITITGTYISACNGNYVWNATANAYLLSTTEQVFFDTTNKVWRLQTQTNSPQYVSLTNDLFGAWMIDPSASTAGPTPTVMPTNALDGNFRNLGFYEPSETHPRYRRSRLNNFTLCCSCTTNNSGTNSNAPRQRQIQVLAKLSFIPALLDTDFLMIDNLEAIKLCIQSIKAEEANDFQTAEAFLVRAIREMNLEERDLTPDEQTPVHVEVLGGHRINSPI